MNAQTQDQSYFKMIAEHQDISVILQKLQEKNHAWRK